MFRSSCSFAFVFPCAFISSTPFLSACPINSIPQAVNWSVQLVWEEQTGQTGEMFTIEEEGFIRWLEDQEQFGLLMYSHGCGHMAQGSKSGPDCRVSGSNHKQRPEIRRTWALSTWWWLIPEVAQMITLRNTSHWPWQCPPGRLFSSTNQWFSGSMLVFQGVLVEHPNKHMAGKSQAGCKIKRSSLDGDWTGHDQLLKICGASANPKSPVRHQPIFISLHSSK